MTDRLGAFGQGLGQGASLGWSDELAAKLLAAIPAKDDTGIPREYAGGQYEQYRDSNRQDVAQAQEKFPANFAAGQIAGGLPAAIGAGASVPAAVGLGAATGAGLSERQGAGLAKDAVAGGALGGAFAAGGKALATGARAAAPAIQKLFQAGPPQGPAPAMASAGTGAVAKPPVRAPVPGLNMSERVSDIPMPRQSIPPSSLEAAEIEAKAALRRADAQKAIRESPVRPASGPLDEVPSKIPDAEGATQAKMHVRQEDGERFFAPEAVDKKKLKAVPDEEPAKGTVRPGKKARAR